jgi:hypothetical protein
MFESVERPYEHIFSIFVIEYSVLDEFAQVMFYVREWLCKLIICPLEVLNKS